MIIVGELINASRKAVGEAISAQDAEAIKKLAVDQHEAGANYIDVNAGIFVGQEAGYLQWLVKTVQGAVDAPCCIDSPDPKAIENALSVHKGTAMINSISLEKDRYNALLPVVAGTDLKVVALCMSDEGMPETTEDRVKIADQLINDLVKNNIPLDNIYVDPLVQPVSTKSTFGDEFLNAVDEIMTRFKGVHTICGLSNISYGLPLRQMLNQTFAVMAIARGLDALIINPLDSKMIQNLIAAETLAGRDDYCMNYLKAYRKKKFE
ncbi:methyltetrahydrofolate cobalamin methyltransferase [Syntrophaceticus schinkii]|jgi:cobalamin-dependent methionine synthase I|uniref:Pterin binding enzyme n=1 Tax=Syntrophaceticus schinkii TaxID=499207 RepID=A0A0B7MNP4_9FIRM|nr:methyltetrahydrofolate cobalamin methyltransferase [Syntrophaceticus schinkii]MDD2360044.1 methyltetrahydrofolate cobalamin methyltransferase [Syntrophaceticus schinkii]CEO89332.1 Pterin binding enzyme [Syntrophaceticus schinkii]